MPRKKLTKRILNYFFHPLVFAVALFIVFEEWLWDTLKALFRRLSRLPPVAVMESYLKRLNPSISLLVLLLPGIVLIPFKIAALYLVSHHRPFLGILVLLAAKLMGTAVAAYVFDLVRSNARKLSWFNTLYLRVIGILTSAKTWLHRQPTYVWMHKVMANLKAKMQVKITRKSWILRKLQAAKILAQHPKAQPKNGPLVCPRDE